MLASSMAITTIRSISVSRSTAAGRRAMVAGDRRGAIAAFWAVLADEPALHPAWPRTGAFQRLRRSRRNLHPGDQGQFGPCGSLALIQISWLGFPNTTGAPFFDYTAGRCHRDASQPSALFQQEARPAARPLSTQRSRAGGLKDASASRSSARSSRRCRRRHHAAHRHPAGQCRLQQSLRQPVGRRYETLATAQEAGAATINVGVFIILAFAVFLLVRSINRLKRRVRIR